MPLPQAPRPLPTWAKALIQSAMAALFVLLAFFAIYRFHSKLAIASLAASAFIAFGFPGAESARARYILGGYACGVACGAACCLALHRLLPPHWAQNTRTVIMFCALAVFLTAFCMILLNLQHPPAAALAVSMVLEPDPIRMGLYMLGCALVLCLLRRLAVRLLGKRLER